MPGRAELGWSKSSEGAYGKAEAGDKDSELFQSPWLRVEQRGSVALGERTTLLQQLVEQKVLKRLGTGSRPCDLGGVG